MTPRAQAVRRSLSPPSISDVIAFYRHPVAWVALIVSSALLTYGGGAVMFWFHAIFRGENGPPISDVQHWLLDSSLGFFALTPVLAYILPIGVRAAAAKGRSLRVYVVMVAALFTLTTGPGPMLHNLIAGAHTPLARLAVNVVGVDPGVMDRVHPGDRSPLTEGLFQILVGLPTYMLCTWLSLHFVRVLSGQTRRLLAAKLTRPLLSVRTIHPKNNI